MSLKQRLDAEALELVLRSLGRREEPGDRYESVGEYDAVLRWHCRL